MHQKLNFVGNIWREFDSDFGKDGAKIGSTLRVRLPNQFTVSDGPAITAQNTVEQSITLTVGTQKVVPMEFLTSEMTMSIDDFTERMIEPAAAQLASAVESDAFNMVKDVAQQVGIPGTTPNDLLTYLSAKARLDQSLAPASQRNLCLDPLASATILNSLKTLFNPQDTISKQYHEGAMGRSAGFDWYMNTLIQRITNGNTVAAVTTGTTPLTGATLGLATIASGNTFVKGSVFTIVGVNDVHPETKQNLGVLKKFTVRTTFSAIATTGIIDISPSIIATGAYQNVSAAPVAGVLLAFDGTASLTYPVSIAFHKQAFTFAAPPLFMPKGVDMGSRQTQDGISLRLIRDYVPTSDQLVTRLDILYGYQTIRQQIACRIASGVV